MTGTIDTAAQFLGTGLKLLVTCDLSAAIEKLPQYDVVALNLESRHDPPHIAYKKAKNAASKAKKHGASIIFKKTDSALRGNVGAELKGTLEGFEGRKIHLLPAFPQKNRLVLNQTLWIDGLPANLSAFADDLLNPIQTAHIPSLIRATATIEVFGEDQSCCNNVAPCVIVYDTASISSMREKVYQLLSNISENNCFAGCAGLANILAENLFTKQANLVTYIHQNAPTFPVLFISGSINVITTEQIAYAKKVGMCVHLLSPAQKTSLDYWNTPNSNLFLSQIEKDLKARQICIVATTDQQDSLDVRKDSSEDSSKLCAEIAQNIAQFVKQLYQRAAFNALVVFGGDTLTAILRELSFTELDLQEEIDMGTVLCRTTGTYGLTIVTKSGGFGSVDVIPKICSYFRSPIPAKKAATIL